jgi:peptidoglycan/LPS O-acetylase OafA/YrhL
MGRTEVSLLTAPDVPLTRPDESPTKPTRLNYRPDIDGIRGTAAIMVMGFHAGVPGFEGSYIGLDLFFVVSGFVIANLLLGEYNRNGRIKWSAFYARRARRLIPAKATMLIGVLLLSLFLLAPTGSQQETAKSAAAAAGFVSNVFFWRNDEVSYFGHAPGTGVLLHTWSLSVEEQFYVAMPFLILLAWVLAKLLRSNVRVTLLFVCLALFLSSLWLAINWADADPESAYYLPFSRAFEFLLGVALSLIVSKVTAPFLLRQVMGLVGAALVIYVLVDPMPTDGYPKYWALIPCMGAFLMTWAGCGSPTWVTRFLSFRLFVWLGLLSYGWYLWHWPLLVMGESVNLAPPPLWMKVALVMVALGIAYLSWRYIEGIFYNRSGGRPSGYTWGPRRVVLAGVSSMTTVAVLAAGTLVVADDQADSPHWEAVNEQLNDFPRLPEECASEEDKIPQRPVLCRLNGQQNDRGTVVLWGDSHAWMYIPALEAAAEKVDVNLVAFTQGSCPPFDPSGMDPNNCVRGNQLAFDFVDDLAERGRPVRVLLGASWEIYFGGNRINLMVARGGNPAHERYVAAIAPLFLKGGVDLFDHLADLKVGVDVIAPVAEVPRNAPLCEAQLAHLYSCDIAAASAAAADQVARTWLLDQMDKLAGEPRLIDVNDAFCADGVCRARVGDTLTYFDNNHLSASFSSTLGKYFAPTLQDAADDAEALKRD